MNDKNYTREVVENLLLSMVSFSARLGNKRLMQENALWQAVLGEIELTVSRGSFVTWFKNTRLLRNKDNVLVIGVPNIFIKQQLERKFNDLITGVLANNDIHPEKIEYKIHSGMGLSKRVPDETVVLANPSPRQETQARPLTTSVTHSYRLGLNERYTFENFIVGSGNELAYAACQAIAQSPGTRYNPLFIYGGVGIGKTHLIQAVGNAVMANQPDARVVYISTEQFVQEFLDAIRYKKNTDFAGYYRSADVLIVDDMQFIAGKEKTQEEFFHTFNALHQANKQIIISSDKPPKDIPTLTDRLRSRFEWGMSIDMQTPDFETRCAIVQTKAHSHNTTLPAPVVEYLATHIQTNIRELEGALNQLLAFCEMRNLQPDLQIVTSLFGATKNRPKHLSAKTIVERTAKHFQIQLDDILGPKRDKDIVVPRQVAMYLLRSELHMSFPKIAHELGRKDHTTAIHSVEKIEAELSLDVQIRQHVTDIKERLYA
jgi:chromosomal replication initiator protein